MSIYYKWHDFVVYASGPDNSDVPGARFDFSNAVPYGTTPSKGNIVTQDVLLRVYKLPDGELVEDVFEAMEIDSLGVVIWTKYRIWFTDRVGRLERLRFIERNPPARQ